MKKARTEIFEPEVCVALGIEHGSLKGCVFLWQCLQDESMGRNAQTCGLSWVKSGTNIPFSRDDS